jgi:GlcNAc-P-P-Und epimerase
MIAVSGANGFVGSHVLRALSAAGLEAVGMVRHGGAENGMRVVADWSEAGLRAALAGVTSVVHAASVVHRPGTDPAEYERFNRDGTRALIAAARGAEVRQVILLSTIKVYGEERLDCADEGTPPAPQDPYSTTKLAAEEIVLGAAAEGGPVATVLRLAPVYGRGDKGNVRRVISAIASRRFALPGSGSTRKSLVHVSTVAEVIRAALSQRRGGLFVVADREAPSMRELADAASAALGLRRATALPAWLLEAIALPIESACALIGREPPVSRALLRKSMIPTVCSPGKVERELGISCHVDLTAAVADEVAWMRESGLL